MNGLKGIYRYIRVNPLELNMPLVYSQLGNVLALRTLNLKKEQLGLIRTDCKLNLLSPEPTASRLYQVHCNCNLISSIAPRLTKQPLPPPPHPSLHTALDYRKSAWRHWIFLNATCNIGSSNMRHEDSKDGDT